MNAPKGFMLRQKTQRKSGSKLSGMLIIILLFSIIGGYKMYLSNRTATPTTETATITNETDFEKFSRIRLNPGLVVSEPGMRAWVIGFYNNQASEDMRMELRAKICPVISDFPICQKFNFTDQPHVYGYIDFNTRAYNVIDRAGLTNVNNLFDFFKKYGMGWKEELKKRVKKNCGPKTLLDIERAVLVSEFGYEYLKIVFDEEEVATIENLDLSEGLVSALKEHQIDNIYKLIVLYHQGYWEGFDHRGLKTWLTDEQLEEIRELVEELLTPGF